MSTFLIPPASPADLSNKHMNSVSTSQPAHVIAPGSAANADHLGERAAAPVAARVEAPAGWDAYDRRQHQD
jgi:hypothetical protein